MPADMLLKGRFCLEVNTQVCEIMNAMRKKVWVWFIGAGVLILVCWNFSIKQQETSAARGIVARATQLQELHWPQKDEAAGRLHHHLYTGPQLGAMSLPLQQGCRVQVRPWFIAGMKYEHVQLIFYGKPVMQAIKRICVKRGWKMVMILHDNEAGVRELQRLVSHPQTFTILFTISRAFHLKLVQDLANSTNALVSAIRYSFTITGAKKGQLTNCRSFFANHGCNLRELEIMPASFLLDDPKDCKEFFKYSQTRPLSWWILKPSKGYGGEGITVHKNLSHFYKNYAVCSQTKEQFVVQEYLSDLLLIEGRKFDVRAHILIAGTSPYILFYHEGYLRLSMEKFDARNSGRSSMHLTNSHIQTLAKNYSPDKHFWSFKRFQDYLNVHHPENNNFVSDRLVPFIKKVGLSILQSGE
jgi:hypothetical protein